MKTAEERIASVRKHVPRHWKWLYDKCTQGKATLQEQIDCHCFGCMGWAYEDCGCVACPQFHARPFGKRQRLKIKISEEQRAAKAQMVRGFLKSPQRKS